MYLKHKWYRRWRVGQGYRSFAHHGEEQTSYLIFKGEGMQRFVVEDLLAKGWVEEWARD